MIPMGIWKEKYMKFTVATMGRRVSYFVPFHSKEEYPDEMKPGNHCFDCSFLSQSVNFHITKVQSFKDTHYWAMAVIVKIED